MNFKIEKVVDLGENYGDSVYLADVDGDGVNELIFRQSCGILTNSMLRKTGFHGYMSDDNVTLLRHSCIRADGTELWHSGEAWKHERPYASHGSGAMTRVADINADGKDEIIYIGNGMLCIARSEDFSLIRSIELFNDCIDMIYLQKVAGGKVNILLKASGLSKWGDGRPLIAYDCELNLLWKYLSLANGGHGIILRDIDGDGQDEIFEGYNLLDHDGTLLWSFDFPSHADFTNVVDINGDGKCEVIYCTDNEDYIVCTVDGEHLYTIADFPHPQNSTIGRFRKDAEGTLQNFMNNRATHGGSAMIDYDGKMLWDFPVGGYSSLLKNADPNGLDLIFFKPGPGRMPLDLQEQMHKRAAELGYKDPPISGNTGFEPMILSGSGEILFRFPVLEESIDVTKWDIKASLKADHGAGFNCICGDVDGDGESEFVFFNRRRMWILKSTEPFPYTLSSTGD